MTQDMKDEQNPVEEAGLEPKAETVDAATTAATEEEAGAEQASAGNAGESAADSNAEVQELKDQLLRAHAEMQNIRRRSEQEVEKARKFALERFAKELLPVVDSLEKAIEASKGEAADSATLSEGVDMTLSLFMQVLNRSNVEEVNPLNETFNPEYHEAMSMVPNADLPPNTVMAVLQKGYVLNGRLIRPAMVMVSKAP